MSTADLVWEPSERWVRGRAGTLTVVDSRRPRLVWEPESPVPGYVFPREDVRTDLLRPAAKPPAGGAHAGARVFYDLETTDGDVRPNAAWSYPQPELAEYIGFEWFEHTDTGLDHWYEEDEEIFVHPRDPHKRVDALRSSRHVVVEIGGEVAADSHRPVLLFETGLPTRYYLPPEDVRLELFTPTEHSTACPYKGQAQYWSWAGPGGAGAPEDISDNIAWSYPEPLPAVSVIRNLIAFYNEAVDITVDGERQPRPQTGFLKRKPREGD